jgi:hypothetical protein
MTNEQITKEKADRFDDVCKLIAVRNSRIMEIKQLDEQILNAMLFDEKKNTMPEIVEDHSL